MISVSASVVRRLGALALAIVLISSVAENHSSAAPLGETESAEQKAASKSELYTRRALDLIFGREGNSYRRKIVYKRVGTVKIFVAADQKLDSVRKIANSITDELERHTGIEFNYTNTSKDTDILVIVYREANLNLIQKLNKAFEKQTLKDTPSKGEMRNASCFDHVYGKEAAVMLYSTIFVNGRLDQNTTRWCLVRHLFGAMGGWGLDQYVERSDSYTVYGMNTKLKLTSFDSFLLRLVYSEDISPGDGIDEVVAKISSMNK